MPHLLETLTAVVSDLTRRHHLPDIIKLSPLQGDASARRYFRVNTSSYSMILMDCRALIDITTAFSSLTTSLIKQQIPAPHILAATPDRGLMLLEDFGDTTLLHDLTQHKTTSPYDKAVQLLVRLQCIPRSAFPTLPTYSHEKLMAECHVFPHWFLNRFLKLKLSTAQHYNLNLTFEYLINNALAQPSCFVHRDYHSRNLMVKDNGSLGLIDYQDAVWGAAAYDWASLLKDCYITMPRSQQLVYLKQGHHALQADVNTAPAWDSFLKDYDLIGLQRHLKVLGVFSRLALRDGKTTYLNDIPRIINYIKATCQIYPELMALSAIMRMAEAQFNLQRQQTTEKTL